jgi:hypothetical protein
MRFLLDKRKRGMATAGLATIAMLAGRRPKRGRGGLFQVLGNLLLSRR